MALSLSVDEKNLHPVPSSNHHVSSQSSPSPISPDSPDNIEKPHLPLISSQNQEKPAKVVSTQWVDDPTQISDFHALSKRDAKLKHRIRVFKFVLRLLTFLFALYDVTTMSYTLNLFIRTYNIRRTLYLPPAPVTRGPWHADSKNWPTYLLLLVSSTTCVATFLILTLYLHSVKAANKANARFSQLAYVIFAAHVAVWIGTAVAYRKAKDGTDLWGWSCTHEARVVLQPFFRDVVDFGLSCRIQTSSWAISVAQAALTTLNFLLFWISYQRYRSQTGLKSLSASPTGSSNCSGENKDQSPQMTVDHEKQQMIAEHEREQNAEKEGGEKIDVEDEPEQSLRKKLLPMGFKMGLGYITTYVNVFN